MYYLVAIARFIWSVTGLYAQRPAYFGFPVTMIPPKLHTQSFIYHRCYTVLATDTVVTQCTLIFDNNHNMQVGPHQPKSYMKKFYVHTNICEQSLTTWYFTCLSVI